MIPKYLELEEQPAIKYGRLTFKDGYFHVMDGSPAVNECAKRVLPGSAGRNSKSIRFPANRRAVGELTWMMARYPLEIECRDEFDRWHQAAVEHSQRRTQNAAGVQQAIQSPLFRGELYDFQAEAVTFLTSNQRALLADDMGLGKTISAIASMLHVDQWPVLIVVPPNVRQQWCDQIRHFTGIRATVLTGRQPVNPLPAQAYVISYNLLADWKDVLLSLEPEVVVYDEVQELRHTGTHKYSAASLLSETRQFVWGLSGTPIYNHGIEMWSVLNIVEHHCLGSKEAFSREWCDGYGNERVTKPAELGDYLKQEGLLLRRRKRDVDHQLPPKHRVSHMIDHDENKYAELMQRAIELGQQYDQIHGWNARGRAAAEIEQETRRATGVAKAPYVVQFVRSLIEAGEKPLVYAWHHDVHDIITEGLADYRIGKITGKDSQAAKQRAIADFGSGKTHGVLLSLRATAGIDGLQKAATCVVFAELDWSPAIHSQSEDRAHRFGMCDIPELLVYYLVSQTGYDGVVMDALGVKIGQFVGIMGDPMQTDEQKVRSEQAAEKHLQKILAAITTEGIQNVQTA